MAGNGCRVFGLVVTAALASNAAAQVSVDGGATLDLGGGRLELARVDLRVEGAMALGTGFVESAGTVSIGAGGVLFGEDGSLRTGGGWRNQGVFDPGTSRVTFVDGPLGTVSLEGETTFHLLELLAGTDRTYRLQASATQTVTSLLRIRGTAEAPVQIASTAAGQPAFLHLVADGSQDIGFVGVSDVHATGAWLAAGQTNMGGAGNALRWFGDGPEPPPPPAPPQPVPLGQGAFVWLLSGLLALAACRAFRRPPVRA